MKGAVVRGTLAAAVLSLPAPAQAGGLPRQAPGQPGQGLSMAFGAPVLVEAGRDYAGLACVGDFDVDGTNDVAFAGGFVLESNGPISITLLGRSYHARTSEAVGNPSANPLVTFPYARSADLDRDGFPDLVAIGQHGGIAVVRPLGAAQVDATLPRYRATHLAPAALDPMRWSALRVIPRVFLLEDVTGDGCVDLIFSGDFEDLVGRAGVTGLLLFPGDGLGGFRDPVTLVPKRVLGASVADLDGNRLPDVAAVDDESRLHWLLQRKRGQLDGFSLQVTELTHPEKVRLVDLDGDRRRDYVVVQGLEGSTIELALLINRGD
ncbi:MAG: VCBS repeat-containing protein, partial [Planctomycetota bacterium]